MIGRTRVGAVPQNPVRRSPVAKVARPLTAPRMGGRAALAATELALLQTLAAGGGRRHIKAGDQRPAACEACKNGRQAQGRG